MIDSPIKSIIGWVIAMVIIKIALAFTTNLAVIYTLLLIIAVLWWTIFDPPNERC